MKTVKVGVLGLGWFGQKHAQVFAQLPQVELVAVCSRTEARARQIAAECGAERSYSHWDAFLADPEIEAVSVVTHIHEHRAAVLQALDAGKHVLVEKPIAATLADADAMIAAAQTRKLLLMVGHILRFETRYAQAKAVLDDGRLGKVLSIYARRNIPGHFAKSHLQLLSSLTGDAIHDTDLMLWYTRDRVRSVYATTSFVGGAPHADVGWCVYNFAGGGKGVCESLWALSANTPYAIDARMEIVGEAGALYIDCSEGGLAIQDRNGWKWPDTMHWSVVHGRTVGALQEELAYFVDCVATGRAPTLAPPEEAREALRVVLAAEESARSQTVVQLETPN
jgi:UDP-N-acetylglucosamine 3-dehydrogenase